MREKRCYGCMKKIGDAVVCPHCGYDNSKPNEDYQLPAGTVLKEQYLVGRVLGQGGFGITYMGWDQYLEMPVAIKEYYPTGAVSRNNKNSTDVISGGGEVGSRFRNNKERFMREVKMLARLSGIPEIVQVKTFFLANNTAYIVMEYIEGITLKEYVREHGGKLGVEETLDILGPIIKALQTVHRTGVVHRDISPDNIMIQNDGDVRLVDFGAVRDVGLTAPDQPLTKSTEAILKQGYAPVEQYQSRGSLGPWTDIYAMCATIYFCLTGEAPADAPGRILGEDISWFQELGIEVPDYVEKTLKRGMEIQTRDRIQDMGELYRRLFRTGGDEDTDDDDARNGSSDDIGGGRSGGTYGGGDCAGGNHVGGTCIGGDHIDKNRSDGDRTDRDLDAVDGVGRKNGLNGGKGGDRRRLLLLGGAAVLLVLAAFAGWRLLRGGQGGGPDVPGQPETELASELSGAETGAAGSEESELPADLITGACGDYMTYSFDPSTGVLTILADGKDRKMWDFGVDSEERHDLPWDEYRDTIEKVVISENVAEVGQWAFSGCSNLKQVEGLEYVREIRDGAFADTALESVMFGDRLVRIGDGAFGGCRNLDEIEFPESLESVAADAFKDAGVMKAIIHGEPELDHYAFGETFKLWDPSGPEQPLGGPMIFAESGSKAEAFAEELQLPFVPLGQEPEPTLSGQCGEDVYWELDLESGVLTLSGEGEPWRYRTTLDDTDAIGSGPEWSSYRNFIRKVVVEPGVTKLTSSLFTNCVNLTEFDFGTVEEIDVNAITNSGLVSVEFPETLRRIVDYGLQHNLYLESVVIPESVEELTIPFAYCKNLKEITILGNPTFLDMNSEDAPGSTSMVYDGNPVILPEDEARDENITIRAHKGGTAEAYAKKYGNPFVALDEEE